MRRLTELFWSWTVVPIGLIGTGIYATVIGVLGSRNPASASVDRLLRSWANSWIRLTRIDLDVRGGESLDPKTSYVVVANHLSNDDIMI